MIAPQLQRLLLFCMLIEIWFLIFDNCTYNSTTWFFFHTQNPMFCCLGDPSQSKQTRHWIVNSYIFLIQTSTSGLCRNYGSIKFYWGDTFNIKYLRIFSTSVRTFGEQLCMHRARVCEVWGEYTCHMLTNQTIRPTEAGQLVRDVAH